MRGRPVADRKRWGLWAPFDYISSMAINSGFSPTLALYLISLIKYFFLFCCMFPF